MTTAVSWADPRARGKERKGKNPPPELLQQVVFAFLPSSPLLHGARSNCILLINASLLLYFLSNWYRRWRWFTMKEHAVFC